VTKSYVLGQSEIVTEKLAGYSNRIENDKESVTKPSDDTDVGVHQVEGVVRVADDLRQRPGKQHQGKTDRSLETNLLVFFDDFNAKSYLTIIKNTGKKINNCFDANLDDLDVVNH